MNKRSTCILLLIAVCSSISSRAQTWQRTESRIKTEINSIDFEVQFFSPAIVRIIKSPAGRRFTKESLSVISKPQKTSFSIKQHGDFINLKTANLNVALNRTTGNIVYSTAKAEPLFKEKEGSTKCYPVQRCG